EATERQAPAGGHSDGAVVDDRRRSAAATVLKRRTANVDRSRRCVCEIRAEVSIPTGTGNSVQVAAVGQGDARAAEDAETIARVAQGEDAVLRHPPPDAGLDVTRSDGEHVRRSKRGSRAASGELGIAHGGVAA